MSTPSSETFTSINCTNILVPENSSDSLILPPDEYMNGFYMTPSPGVPGRPSILGYILTATTNDGKIELSPPPSGLFVSGEGSVWFSDHIGGPIGNNGNFFWDDTNIRLGIGNNTPAYELDITGSAKLNNLYFYNSATPSYVVSLGVPLLIGSFSLVLPDSVGTAGQLLTTDGAGQMSWTDPNTTVPGAGNIWFSDAFGDPQGTANFTWSGTVLRVVGDILSTTSLSISNSGFQVSLESGTLTGNLTFTLPVDTGTPNQVLTTDGAGVLTWTDKGSGGQTVAGIGSVWFSDISGLPIGSTAKFNWDTGADTLSIDGIFNLINDSGDNFTIIASNTQTVATLSWVLPTTSGTLDQVLTTDGAGVLSWTSKGGGGQTVAGLGSVWFSDAGGLPIGDNTNFNWDDVNNILTAGSKILLNNGLFQFSIEPDTLTQDIDWVIPADYGTSGFVLSTDGSGNLSWVTNGVASVPSTGAVWYSDGSGAPIGNNAILSITAGIPNVLLLTGVLDIKEGLNKTRFQASASQAVADIILTLPINYATNGQLLSSTGAGVLSWIDPVTATVAGQYRIWVSNATGNPIGSADFTWDGATLQVVGDGVFVGVSCDSLSLINGIFTLDLIAPTLTGNLTFTLPDSAGSNGQLLTTNGAGVLSWSTVTVLTPAGNNGNVQFKNGTVLGGTDDFNWNGTVLDVTNVGNNATVTTDILTVGPSFDVTYTGVISGVSEVLTGSLESTSVILENTAKTVTLTASASQVPANTNMIFPTTAGTTGQYLSTDGAGVLSWGSANEAGGLNTEVQFNSSGVLAGSSSFTWSGTILDVTNVGNTATVTTDILTVGPSFDVTYTGVISGVSEVLTGSLESTSVILENTAKTVTLTASASQVPANTNLIFPTTAGTSGQFLSTDGAGVLSWLSETVAVPAGNSGNVQFNNAGAFGGTDDFNWNGTILDVTNVGNTATVTTDILTVGPSFDVTYTGVISGVSEVLTGSLESTSVILENTAKTVTLTASASQVPANTNLIFPTTVGASGQFLSTDGAGVLSWLSETVAVPAGNSGNVQFNNAGAFGGTDDFNWNGTILDVTNVGNTATVTTDILTVGPSFDVTYTGVISGVSEVLTGSLESTSVILENTAKTVTLTASASQVPANTNMIFPTTAGTTGQYLSTDGAGVLSWGSANEAGGNNTEVQFNSSGVLAGSSIFTWSGTVLTVGNMTLDTATDTVTAAIFTATSDERLKENIVPINASLASELLESINCYKYNLIGKEIDTFGVIAQELESVGLEQMVFDGPSGFKSVDYNQLIPLLVETVKQLSREIKNLKQQWN